MLQDPEKSPRAQKKQRKEVKKHDIKRLSSEGFDVLDCTIALFRTFAKLKLYNHGATRYFKYFHRYMIKYVDSKRVFRDEK